MFGFKKQKELNEYRVIRGITPDITEALTMTTEEANDYSIEKLDKDNGRWNLVVIRNEFSDILGEPFYEERFRLSMTLEWLDSDEDDEAKASRFTTIYQVTFSSVEDAQATIWLVKDCKRRLEAYARGQTFKEKILELEKHKRAIYFKA